jgi:hypothetical protein
MMRSNPTHRRRASRLVAALALVALAGCSNSDPNLVQGYVEGE